jgi:hypothetical protein
MSSLGVHATHESTIYHISYHTYIIKMLCYNAIVQRAT